MASNSSLNSSLKNISFGMYPLGYLSLQVFLAPVIIIGCILNVSVMAGICTDKKMQRTENMFHLNLAFIDTLILISSTLVIPIEHMDESLVRDALKAIHCSLFAFACATNLFALIEIAVLRVKRFTKYHFKISKSTVCGAIFANWFVGVICAINFTLSSHQQINPLLCGTCLKDYKIIPGQFATCVRFLFIGGGSLVLIGTFCKCLLHLLKLKQIQPTSDVGQASSQNNATSEEIINNFTDVATVYAIELEVFQCSTHASPNRDRQWVQPSPHFVARRRLVVTTFILLLCSLCFLVLPILIAYFIVAEDNLVFSIAYFLIVCNSTLVPIIYIVRYEYFQKVIKRWLNKYGKVCRVTRE